ncbi:ATP-binding protein [Aquipuribacter hungaricus]|uniref:histidine kinase n=1 Tax=Aquipuribacter hungaricus TaxID=545624 RepID=A0ABV7WJE6_9MICO
MTSGLTREQLRELFLFEALTDDRLDFLSQMGDVIDVPAGTAVFREGEPAECFYVLLSGTVSMTRVVQGDEVEITRTDHVGSYGGATQAYVRPEEAKTYSATFTAVTDCRLFSLPGAAFAALVREWFPMAVHLLEGLFLGMQNSQTVIGQRERLLALGSLTAGLTHELNNPAAAAVRATSALRERVRAMHHKLAMLADATIEPKVLTALAGLQDEALAQAGKGSRLSALAASDAEDELVDWMDTRDVQRPFDLAPPLVAAGIRTDWLDGLADRVPAHLLESGLRWIVYSLETEQLMAEIEDATGRVSALVGAAKQYSQMDRSAQQTFDVHDGLEATMVMLGRKLQGLQVVTDFDRTLPSVPGFPGELNQVWTNLLDNAAGAMAGQGTLTVRTARDGDSLLVEVGDTGPGVPEELQRRIFEPFFTTKPVGEGTGLGLDISFRIVVGRHGGDLRVHSVPGDTRFQVRLPLRAATPPAVVPEAPPAG